MKKSILGGLIQSACLAIYVGIIASIMTYGDKIFGVLVERTVLMPIIMLLLFTFSAAVCAILVFGRPVMWYLDGKKKEAIQLLGATMAWILIIMICVAVIAIIVAHTSCCCGSCLR